MHLTLETCQKMDISKEKEEKKNERENKIQRLFFETHDIIGRQDRYTLRRIKKI